MVEIKFIPLDYSPIEIQGKNYMRVFGKTDKGESICVFDKFENHFYILAKNLEKLKGKIERNIDDIKVEIVNKNYLEQPVKALKITTENKKIKDIADQVKDLDPESKRKELDINLTTRYIIEKNFKPLQWHTIKGRILNNDPEIGGNDAIIETSQCILAEKIEPIEKEKESINKKTNKNYKPNDINFSRINKKLLPHKKGGGEGFYDEVKVSGGGNLNSPDFKPKVLAFDIETDAVELGKGQILMISLASKNFKKVITWKKSKKKKDYVELVKDEAEMIEKFLEHVKQIKPDIITGYFSDGFDLPYLRARANKHKIKLSLGIDGTAPRHQKGNLPSAKICGIPHVDLYKFIATSYSQYMNSETLGLDDVAEELIGENKIKFDLKFTPEKIKAHEWDDYFGYNLRDSEITYKLFEKIWPDLLEFTKVIQEPLYDISRDTMSQQVENYLMHNLNRFNEIIESHPKFDEIEKRKAMPRYEGAFVLTPEAGLYKDIAFFDFTSMHTSIIVSFNISKATLTKDKKNSFETPEIETKNKKQKFYFKKKQGFFPSLLNELFENRKKAKAIYKKDPTALNKAKSNAFKLLANAAYGYLGFFGARYYSYEAASSVLAFVRKFSKDTIDKVNKEGYKVIMSDTDSVAFALENKSKTQVKEFLKKLNTQLPGIMELELEGFFKRGIWVTKRTGGFGAKKKYALIDELGRLKIRGFETVRRDWCRLARDVQNKVLQQILRDGNETKALEYVKKVITQVKNREVELNDLVIKTQLKKPLSEYKAETPHVTIARKMERSGVAVDIGMLIQYYIAESDTKSKLVRDRVKLIDEPGKYDIEYYLNKQIVPAVENILEVFKVDIKEIADGKNQKKLFDF
ncbi:MAG: DNA-directed DNA polymerase [Nanoarchaeota archaeon]|nr:DNA-directed DNA polymerase [Nanoarchaeota archaeon]